MSPVAIVILSLTSPIDLHLAIFPADLTLVVVYIVVLL